MNFEHIFGFLSSFIHSHVLQAAQLSKENDYATKILSVSVPENLMLRKQTSQLQERNAHLEEVFLPSPLPFIGHFFQFRGWG
jgi:hypothetical protein